MELPFAESWKIKMVEPIRKSTRQEREQWWIRLDRLRFHYHNDSFADHRLCRPLFL